MVAVLIEIIPFNPDDLDAVMEIENQSFPAPWSRQSYIELAPLNTVRFFVVKEEEKLVGYMLYQVWGDEMELHTIAVDPKKRGQGIAHKMMEFLLKNAKNDEVRYIFLQVRPTNHIARHLYKKFGFNIVGIRHNYYHDNHEDALVLKKEL